MVGTVLGWYTLNTYIGVNRASRSRRGGERRGRDWLID